MDWALIKIFSVTHTWWKSHLNPPLKNIFINIIFIICTCIMLVKLTFSVCKMTNHGQYFRPYNISNIFIYDNIRWHALNLLQKKLVLPSCKQCPLQTSVRLVLCALCQFPILLNRDNTLATMRKLNIHCQ